MKKIKHFLNSEKGRDILVISIIILVGLGSFELGRLSKENIKSGVKIEYKTEEDKAFNETTPDSVSLSSNSSNLSQNSQKLNSSNFFASSRGSKYYSLSCSGGKTIKQENRIYFSTSSEAEKAGYELSSSCR